MAGAQPTQDQVQQVQAIIGLDEDLVRNLLRKNHNDVNSAVNSYFEDPLAALKVPTEQTGWQYQDNIPFADDASMGGVPAMSRPPSRADMVDLSAEHAAAATTNTKTLNEQEDMNDTALQQAMEESLRQTLPAQENGVTGTGTHFGPAKREYYEPSSWALTTFSTSRELIEHPPPSKRRRADNAPAFLCGSKTTGYLGPFITIVYGIPLARAALLLPRLNVHGYAHDPAWWSGMSDGNNKALSTDTTPGLGRDEWNVLTEVQCLIAFLDGTNRAYGSVDALADLQAVRNQNAEAPFVRFLEAWKSAALQHDSEEPLTQVFSSVAVRNSGNDQVPAEEKALLCVEPPTNHIPGGETLADLLDTTIWDDDTGNVDDIWISHTAEIFTIRVYNPDSGKSSLNLTVESVWYPDRYMYECREVMLQIRKQVQMIRREIAQCTHLQNRCKSMRTGDDRIIDIQGVLAAAAEATTMALAKVSEPNVFKDRGQARLDIRVSPWETEELGEEIQAIFKAIDQKLQVLEQRKDDLRRRIRQITSQLIRPTPENPRVPYHKYTLRGVATKFGVTYFQRPSKDLIVVGDEADEDSPGGAYHWWRASWTHDEGQQSGPPVPMLGPLTLEQAEAAVRAKNAVEADSADDSTLYSVRQVSESEVLEAVKSERNSALLVYANEHAMEFPSPDLNASLRQFVERDNQAFAEEIREEEGGPATGETASGGREVETEFEDVPLIDPNASSSSVRELTPMSTSSPDQDDEGRTSSPKPVKEGSLGAQQTEQPPSYEESLGKQEMQERRGNKIGLYAEQMLQKYGGDDNVKGDFAHVEHTG